MRPVRRPRRHVGRAQEVADRRPQGFAERLVALLDHGVAEAPPGRAIMREIALLVMLEEAEVGQAVSGLVEHRKRLEPRLYLAARENSCGLRGRPGGRRAVVATTPQPREADARQREGGCFTVTGRAMARRRRVPSRPER
jgi:hypothetical protein